MEKVKQRLIEIANHVDKVRTLEFFSFFKAPLIFLTAVAMKTLPSWT